VLHRTGASGAKRLEKEGHLIVLSVDVSALGEEPVEEAEPAKLSGNVERGLATHRICGRGRIGSGLN
jgi:hypothetical protein